MDVRRRTLCLVLNFEEFLTSRLFRRTLMTLGMHLTFNYRVSFSVCCWWAEEGGREVSFGVFLGNGGDGVLLRIVMSGWMDGWMERSRNRDLISLGPSHHLFHCLAICHAMPCFAAVLLCYCAFYKLDSVSCCRRRSISCRNYNTGKAAYMKMSLILCL
jgi:hypothetical protein